MRSLSHPRTQFAIGFAARHLLVSAAVAALAALLVFVAWYPAPTAKLLDVGHIYLTLLVVDVVCGPLLTLVLASPQKSRRELAMDLAIVGLLQLGALAYGLYALEKARPVAVVFEQDRLVVVSKNELYNSDCSEQCFSPALVGMKLHISNPDLAGHKRLDSLNLSLQGISLAMRPATWQEWNWSNPLLQSAVRPLTGLKEAGQEKLAARKGNGYVANPHLTYLPLVSSKTLDWIAVFDREGQWIDSFPVDGFN